MSSLVQKAKATGIVSETMVIAALTLKGYQVSLPYGDNAAYDIVAEINGQLKRIQVKTAIHSNQGSFVVKLHRAQKKIVLNKIIGSTIRRYQLSEIDYIACYSDLYKRVYLIPMNDLERFNLVCTLRVFKSKFIKMRKDTLRAKKYEIHRFCD